jgi:hypothetical protein
MDVRNTTFTCYRISVKKKEEKKSDMLLISSTLPPTSERISKTLTTFKGICKNYTQIRDSMHYLLLII